MPNQTRKVSPNQRLNTVRDESGEVLFIPEGWALLKPGDASLTRRVKALGPSWTVQEKKGRKMFSRGVWAPRENILVAKEQVEKQRQDPAAIRKLEASRERRAKAEVEYGKDFELAIFGFLNFHETYKSIAQKMAKLIAVHALPVGSGTVARTKMIPIEKRASAAVIAWMRHQTTAYDNMSVARIKGARRELRRELAEQSRKLLMSYRQGREISADCPLKRALESEN
jgi:hypothetical protein